MGDNNNLLLMALLGGLAYLYATHDTVLQEAGAPAAAAVPVNVAPAVAPIIFSQPAAPAVPTYTAPAAPAVPVQAAAPILFSQPTYADRESFYGNSGYGQGSRLIQQANDFADWVQNIQVGYPQQIGVIHVGGGGGAVDVGDDYGFAQQRMMRIL